MMKCNIYISCITSNTYKKDFSQQLKNIGFNT